MNAESPNSVKSPSSDASVSSIQATPEKIPGELPAFIENTPLLRQMFLDRRFGIALTLLVLVVIGLGITLIRVWPATPPHMSPTIRHTLLDKMQAWSLKRTATQLDAGAEYEKSFTAWRQAIVNHPGDPECHRGLIQSARNGPRLNREKLGSLNTSVNFLIRLTRTNLADVALAAEAVRSQGYPDEAITMLQAHRDALAADGLTTLLKALFETGQISATTPLWSRLHPNEYAQGDLALYRSAWIVAEGAPSEIPSALARVRQAETLAATAVLASRLQLALAEVRDDSATGRRALEYLSSVEADRFQDHTRFWRLLARTGRIEEAQKLARAVNRVPKEPRPFSELVGTLVELGLAKDSVILLEEQLKSHGNFARVPHIWVLRAHVLEQLQLWNELLHFALEIRGDRFISQSLGGYAWYLEALAQTHQGHRADASVALERMLTTGIAEPILASGAATQLQRLGYGEVAAKLLQQIEQKMRDYPDYWFQVQMAAYQSRDLDAFRRSAESAHQLRPTNSIFLNNLAAALLIDRSDPARALTLTRDLYQRAPQERRLALNFALALLQNQQWSEAAALLKDVVPGRLTKAERSAYHQAAFELAVHQADADKARENLQKLDRAQLFPGQIQRMESALAQLRDRGASPAAVPR